MEKRKKEGNHKQVENICNEINYVRLVSGWYKGHLKSILNRQKQQNN